MNKEKNDNVVTGNIRIISKETGKENFYEYEIKKERVEEKPKILDIIKPKNAGEFWTLSLNIPIFLSIIYFVIDGYYKLIMSREFKLPGEYFKIPLSIIFYYLFLIIGIPIALIFIEIWLKETKLFLLMKIVLKVLISIIMLLVLYTNLYFKIIIILEENFCFSILLMLYGISIIITIFFYIFLGTILKIKKEKLYIVYLSSWVLHFLFMVCLLFLSEKTDYEILKIDNEKKVVITTYEDKYLIADCIINENNKIIIIDKEKYNFVNINSEHIKGIQYKKFKEQYFLSNEIKILSKEIKEKIIETIKIKK